MQSVLTDILFITIFLRFKDEHSVWVIDPIIFAVVHLLALVIIISYYHLVQIRLFPVFEVINIVYVTDLVCFIDLFANATIFRVNLLLVKLDDFVFDWQC